MLNDIENIYKTSTKNEKIICEFLFDIIKFNKKINFTTIESFANLLGVKKSSINRFIKKGPWISFKIFYYELKGRISFIESKPTHNNEINKVVDKIDLAKKMDGKNIKFICSNRSTSVCKLVIERLGSIDIKSEFFKGNECDIPNFVNECTNNDLLVLVTPTGESARVNKTIEYIEKHRNKNDLNAILFTSTKIIKYDFLDYYYIENDHELDSEVGYNFSITKLIEIFSIEMEKTEEIKLIT